MFVCVFVQELLLLLREHQDQLASQDLLVNLDKLVHLDLAEIVVQRGLQEDLSVVLECCDYSVNCDVRRAQLELKVVRELKVEQEILVV